MSFKDKLSRSATLAAQSLSSLIRVACLSRPVSKPIQVAADKELVILGNGPSLRTLLDKEPEFRVGRDLMAVNFFAITPEFTVLKPEHYILADPHFFNLDGKDSNVASLWENLLSSSHAMTLHIPANMRRHPSVKKFVTGGNGRNLLCFNMTPGEGFKRVRNVLYSHKLAMPRPRNVMIPAIMEAIASGYKKIYLAGADHTWSRTLSVDESNRVVSVQPHFYKDGAEEQRRVYSEYAGYHLHDILKSLYIAFSSYHLIADFIKERDIAIINITPGSFIDAFPRGTLSSQEKE